MSAKIQVKPVVPLLGGVAGLTLASLQNKPGQQKLTYALTGAALAWTAAAALIVSKAIREQKITPTQAQQLAQIIRDREQQQQSIAQSTGTSGELKLRLDREITYLKGVLSRSKYAYKDGQATVQQT